MDEKKFFYELGRAIYHIDAVYDEFAKKGGVAPTLLWILYALNDGKSHTQREICEDWALPKSTVNTVISELKDNGYVTLVPIKGKRREMTIEITEAGKAYADGILDYIYKKESAVFAALNEEERLTAKQLEKITELLKAL